MVAEGVCYVKVADSSEALGMMVANFYGNPSRKMKLVGVTGSGNQNEPHSPELPHPREPIHKLLLLINPLIFPLQVIYI